MNILSCILKQKFSFFISLLFLGTLTTLAQGTVYECDDIQMDGGDLCTVEITLDNIKESLSVL